MSRTWMRRTRSDWTKICRIWSILRHLLSRTSSYLLWQIAPKITPQNHTNRSRKNSHRIMPHQVPRSRSSLNLRANYNARKRKAVSLHRRLRNPRNQKKRALQSLGNLLRKHKVKKSLKRLQRKLAGLQQAPLNNSRSNNNKKLTLRAISEVL